MFNKYLWVISSFLSLILTFCISYMFNIYHFSSIITLLSLLYIISIFIIIGYILYVVLYLLTNKTTYKQLLAMILVFISLLLGLIFLVVVDIDYLNWYIYSSPFILNVLFRSLQFLLPSLILIYVSYKLTKKWVCCQTHFLYVIL